MLKCKKLFYFFTVLLIIGFAGSAYAAFELTASTDVKVLPASTCNQAGSYTMSAADGLKMHEEDVITFSLTNNVTICDTIDYFLVIADDNTMQVTKDVAYPVYTNENVIGADFINLTGTTCSSDLVNSGSDYVFGLHVAGASGSGVISATVKRLNVQTGVLGPATGSASDWVLEYEAAGSDPNSKLFISLFDEKYNTYGGTDGDGIATTDGTSASTNLSGFIQKGTNSSATTYYGKLYVDKILGEDNALCINTVTGNPTFVNGEYVEATPSSNPTSDTYRLNFTGTYRIAKISGSTAFAIGAVGKGSCPDLSLYNAVDQDGNKTSPSLSFDPGTYTTASCTVNSRWSTASPICQQTDKGRGVIISGSNAFSTNDKYAVSMTLVRAASGSDTYGSTSLAWFKTTSTPKSYWTTSTNSANTSCTVGTAAVLDTTATWTYLATSSFNVVPPNGSTSYTGYHTFSTGSTYHSVGTTYTTKNSIMVDLADVYFDYNNLAVGDKIGVTVTVSKYPCGVIQSGTVCLGTVVATACPTLGTACSMTGSYLVNPANTAYWSGIALTNLGSVAGTATMVFTDSAGGTASVSQAMAANAIETIVFNSTWASALTGSTLDTSKNMRLSITTDFSCEGQVMIGDMSGGGIYGYATRNSCFSSAP